MGILCDLVVDPRKIPIPTLDQIGWAKPLARGIYFTTQYFWQNIPKLHDRFALRILTPGPEGNFPYVIQELDGVDSINDWSSLIWDPSYQRIIRPPYPIRFTEGNGIATIRLGKNQYLLQERWRLNDPNILRNRQSRLADRDTDRLYIPWVIIRLDDLIQFLGGPSPQKYDLVWTFTHTFGLGLMADWLQEHDEYQAQEHILRALIKSNNSFETVSHLFGVSQ